VVGEKIEFDPLYVIIEDLGLGCANSIMSIV
jgi:hypothetical protein